ncbi:MAG: OmpH family outer membrane protein [Pirellulaceae bacterium]
MRFPLFCAALAAPLVFLGVSTAALGQGAPPAGAARPAATAAGTPSGTNVAVIDVALVFKNHVRFNAAMGDIKKDIEAFETYVRGEQTKLKSRAEELQQFSASSAEYKAKEGELARQGSELQVQVGLKRKEFLEQEARVYFRVYTEIEQSVTLLAQRNRIGLVLRFNSEPMKEDARASVLQGVNRAVVYESGINITDQILQDLNRNAAPPTAQGAAVPPRTATGPSIPGRPAPR